MSSIWENIDKEDHKTQLDTEKELNKLIFGSRNGNNNEENENKNDMEG